MEINIEGVRKFDLQKATDAIDYLNYVTENKHNLINLTLINDPDSRLLGEFNEVFSNVNKKEYKYILCWGYSHNLYYTFIDSANKFIFNDYFLNNSLSSDLEKKSRLKLLLFNINNLLKEILIETQMIDFKVIGSQGVRDIELDFENKFQSKIYVTYDYRSNPLKITKYPFCLLLFCLGINLKKIYDKLMVEFSGYVESHLPSTNPTYTEEKSQDIRFFSSERPYNSNFDKLWKEYTGEPKTTSQPNKKRPNWELVFLEILKGNIIIEKNATSRGSFIYKYEEEEFNTPTKLGDKIAEVLKLKKDTIRPILTDTINESGTKQIFTKGHKIAINTILKEVDNKMCVFFQEKFIKLN